jgi:hypothetical protein
MEMSARLIGVSIAARYYTLILACVAVVACREYWRFLVDCLENDCFQHTITPQKTIHFLAILLPGVIASLSLQRSIKVVVAGIPFLKAGSNIREL